MRERELAHAEVMPVALAVGGDVNETARAALAVRQTRDERLARDENAFEGDRARNGAVVEKENDRSPRSVAMKVAVGTPGSIAPSLALVHSLVPMGRTRSAW